MSDILLIMELEKSLEHLGLNEKQAKVYLALLQMGSGSVPAISIKAGTKRPTTYLLLEELRMKGLATLLPKKKKAAYTAESPQKLRDAQREREEVIQESLPELLAIYNSQKAKPKVRFYEGADNINNLIAEIFKSKKVYVYGSVGSVPESVNKIDEMMQITKKNKIEVKEFLQSDKESIEFKNKYNNIEFPTLEVRLAPEGYLLPTENMIFENKVAIFSYNDTPMAVVIESADVVATQKSLFEIAWESGQEIKK
jgi:HTH-type transcriptional regulator, sugar sensing transcriptional regulator